MLATYYSPLAIRHSPVYFFAIAQAGTLWQSGTITNYQPAEAFDVAVAPGTLTLVAGTNAEYGCDTAAWVDVWGVR